jgi:anti-sigma factor RsiW
MNCSEVKDLIQVYLDNELDARNTLEVQRHLEYCPACSRLLEAYLVQDQALKRSARLESVDSSAAREKILATIRNQPPQARFQWLLRPVWRRVAVAAVVIIAVVLLLRGAFVPGINERVYAAVASDHADHCSIEMVMGAITDINELDKLCAEYARMRATPDLSVFGLANPRGRICTVNGEQFLHLIFYDQERQPLSVFAKPHSIDSITKRSVLYHEGGYQVASVSRSGVDVLVVSSFGDEKTTAIGQEIADQL